MPKLTDSHLVILAAAAARDDRALLPFPKSLKLNKGALTAAINSLIKGGLVREQPAERDQTPWRQADGQKLTLIATDAGLKAAGIDVNDEAPVEIATPDLATKKMKTKAKAVAAPAKPPAAVSGTKLGLMIDLLKRKGGATIKEITKATGWQAHSVRGAMSGTLKKKLRLAVESQVTEERGRVYSIATRR